MSPRFFRPLSTSLFARFMTWTAFLLILMVAMIIFFFQRQEVRNIDERSRREGALLAHNIANLNLQALVWWDVETIRRNMASLNDPNIFYIVFFDRYQNLLLASPSAEGKEDIICCSRLPVEVSESTVVYRSAFFPRGSKNLRIMEIEVPVFAPGSAVRWGSVKIGLSLEQMEDEIRRMRTILLIIGSGCGFLGLLGVAILARRITFPLKELMAGTVRVSHGDFSQPIPIRSRDEVGRLAERFNEMTRELRQTRQKMEEAQRKLIQAEKLASIGRIAATIAHEIRNPLTSVKLNIQKVLFGQNLESKEKEHLVLTQEGIEQIEKFVRELLDFTRVSELRLDRFSLQEIITSAAKLLDDYFHEKKINFRVVVDSALPLLTVDGDKIRQVFLNLLRNAQEAVEPGGWIEIKAEKVVIAGKPWVRVLVSDDGCGIPEKDWENVFEPFFTTKSSGFGLGLANARKIIEQHHGQVRIIKKEGKGTCFEIILPGEVNHEFSSRH